MTRPILGGIGLSTPLILWILVSQIFNPPSYLLPKPQEVFWVLIHHYDLLLHHAAITFYEALIALAWAIFLGLITGSLLLFSTTLRAFLLPLLLISQALPIFAIAPLFIVWFGFGMASKIATALLMLYFPITLTFYDGLNSTPQKWMDAAKVYGSTHWRSFIFLQLPFSLGRLGSGLKMTSVWAPMGAVMGEWVGSKEGLGFLMLDAHAKLEMNLVFAALLTLLLAALVLHGVLHYLFHRFIFWERLI